jgi:hypothetical protein
MENCMGNVDALLHVYLLIQVNIGLISGGLLCQSRRYLYNRLNCDL